MAFFARSGLSWKSARNICIGQIDGVWFLIITTFLVIRVRAVLCLGREIKGCSDVYIFHAGISIDNDKPKSSR